MAKYSFALVDGSCNSTTTSACVEMGTYYQPSVGDLISNSSNCYRCTSTTPCTSTANFTWDGIIYGGCDKGDCITPTEYDSYFIFYIDCCTNQDISIGTVFNIPSNITVNTGDSFYADWLVNA